MSSNQRSMSASSASRGSKRAHPCQSIRIPRPFLTGSGTCVQRLRLTAYTRPSRSLYKWMTRVLLLLIPYCCTLDTRYDVHDIIHTQKRGKTSDIETCTQDGSHARHAKHQPEDKHVALMIQSYRYDTTMTMIYYNTPEYNTAVLEVDARMGYASFELPVPLF